MSSTTGSTQQSAEAVRRAAVVTHGRPELIAGAVERLERVAEAHGVELVSAEEQRDGAPPDLVVVLGGDGTMLRAFHRFLSARVPVLGVNFGRVGFLTGFGADELESGLDRVFAGDYSVLELSTLDVEFGGKRSPAVNDVVCTNSTPGRMVELAWAVGGEDLGTLPCDGLVCCTPTGSTAYNLSAGGPVLTWGLDALAVTFVSPHSLHARPLVVPRGRDLTVWNRTPKAAVTVIVDGQQLGELAPDEHVTARLGQERCLLATLPEMTFFRRYRETFAS
ncbi:MAG: NAD(+)/NADH kinase [Gaiellaceae bacterium]